MAVVYNSRSPAQWQIISRRIDFKDKAVFDLGCGRGDLLFRAFEAGASATGVEIDAENVEYIQRTYPGIEVIYDDITWSLPLGVVDVVICFSVLPYLNHPDVILRWINAHSTIALIECQYDGDGPGFHFLRGNKDMKAWLLEVGGFEKVEAIGHTLVEGRDKKRYIWMCD